MDETCPGKWKNFLDHTKNLEKRENGNGRICFLEKCVDNDVIIDFSNFRAPKNDVFPDQAVRGFKFRLLKAELNKARENKAKLDARVRSCRSELCQELNEKFIGSVALNICLSIRKIRLEHKKMNAKLKKLSVRQNKPLKEQCFDSMTILDNISLPTFLKDLLPTAQKIQSATNSIWCLFWQT